LGPIAGILKVNKLLRTLQAEAVNGKNLLGFRSPWVAESCSPFPRNRERIGKAPCVRMVRRSTGGEPRMRRAVANEAAEGAGFEALAATHSRELAKVISDIAAAIRAEAAVKR